MRVSAIIPVFNGEAWIAEALRSISGQTRPADELIVVDDCSTDRSAEIAAAHGARVVRKTYNCGEGAARNTGISEASGDVIAWLDADDYWAPHHLATVIGLLKRNPRATAAFAAVRTFGLENQLIRGYVPPGPPAQVFWPAFRDWLHTTIGSLTRRSALIEIGGFAEDERYSVDFDLWLRLSRQHLFVATHEVTSHWRWHAAQQSRNVMASMAAVYRFRRRYYARELDAGDQAMAEELSVEMRSIWRGDIGRAYANGDRAAVKEYQALASLVPGLSWRDRTLVGTARMRRAIAQMVRRAR